MPGLVLIRVNTEKSASQMIEQIAHFDPLGVAEGLYQIFVSKPKQGFRPA